MASQELHRVEGVWWESLEASEPALRPEQKPAREDAAAFFRTVVAEQCDLWVAERGGEILGVLAMNEDEVDRLYIATRAQRQGIGSALLDHAKALSPEGLRLVALQRNTPARRFYEQHGFVAYAFGRSPAPENEPDVWYGWPGNSQARDRAEPERA